MTQKNSFLTILEKIALLNKNSIELLAKLNDVVSSNKSNITVNYINDNNEISQYELPTIGWLKREIDIINSNIKKLSAIEENSSVFIVDKNSSKKIKSIDLYKEPNPVGSLNVPVNFTTKNNWFFENLMNPLILVEIDLNGKIDKTVSKILSRRYIINFERNEDGTLTTNAQASLNEFKNNFLNKNNFTIEQFLSWLNNPNTLGIVDKDNETLIMDEEIIDLKYKEINYRGFFNVLKIEKDSINNKIWYHLNTLNYYDRSGSPRTLAINDILAINSTSSYTKYRVKEINTTGSLYRVSFERIEGYDPIPIGTAVLKYYYEPEADNKIKISVGFDEYNVIFLKPINTENNIISSLWSDGIAFYTSDLVLDTDNNTSLINYYINNIYDYGAILKEMVAKKVPYEQGVKPNPPKLNPDNFKVVQINKHLTETKNLNNIKNLYSEKISLKSKLDELNQSIIQKKTELNTKAFKSSADKAKAENELNKLISAYESNSKLYNSYVTQLSNSKTETSVEPKYRIRGFWDFPDPIIKRGYKPQEVIGFEIQYRYGSKFNSTNIIESFEIKNNDGTQSRNKIGYFSQWNTIKTDIRKRTYDKNTGKWYWEIEDVSDADTPNINQLDIPIQRNERVDIRIRSISEVGYPDSPLYSDWSDIITIEFPDELNNILNENDFILEEASKEEVKMTFESELSAKGVLRHVNDSFFINDNYYAHNDKNIITSFKDKFGNALSLFEIIKELRDKIDILEESIKRAKGELRVKLFKGAEEIEIFNGQTINIVIECENYMNRIQSGNTFTTKTFKNDIYLIQDYILQIENISKNNDLGIFSGIEQPSGDIVNSGITSPTFISYDGKLYTQLPNQYIWLVNNATINGQNYILYDGDGINKKYFEVLGSDYVNISGTYNNELITTDQNSIWKSDNNNYVFGATVHPYVKYNISTNQTTSEIVDKNKNNIHIIKAGDVERIPINIYFKPDMYDTNNTVTINTSSSPLILNKAIKFRIEEEHKARPFEFIVIFKLIRHKQYAIIDNFGSTTSISNA